MNPRDLRLATAALHGSTPREEAVERLRFMTAGEKHEERKEEEHG